MTAAVHVHGLTKIYGPTRAVDGLDLQIETGEVFALLGPNGAGKTTTVEILEGFRSRDSGQVSVLGSDPATAGAAWRDRIGIVLQSSGGLDLLTPREILRTTARLYERPRAVDEVIASVGLQQKADARIAGLSGGQRRRLDVALGIVGRPDLLFLDEPTTGFDPQARRDFWTLIESLAHEGTTIVLTTHYLDEAEHLADRVAVILGGRIVALDTPTALGGRSAQEATVTWEEAGARHTEKTSAPTALVTALHARLGGEISALTVTRPSLEDTYLALVSAHSTPEQHS
ncbi:MAG: ABC transporter ATP-binding protein [Actinomycetales bacterium]|jgi:ABC-2 type transport system ATP-binding protein|nr:ABC transporter ATP-binding protein [Actinomycetales bacterium]HMT31577.1 ABC transporter ATP-binding protein [Dermatophilaceae bacterium]